MLKFLSFMVFASSVVFSLSTARAEQEFTMSTLPVQNGGRLKPFDTYAREALLMTYGRSKYEGQEAAKIVATWMMLPEAWETKSFIRVDNLGLRKAMNLTLDKTKFFFSPQELLQNPRLSAIIAELSSKREAKEKLDPFDQAAQRLESQLMVFQELKMGGIRLVPPSDKNGDMNSDTWTALAELPEPQKEQFFKVLKEYAATFADASGGSPENLAASIKEFTSMAQASNPALYPSVSKMAIEVHYNRLSPFMWAWILYASAAVLIFLALLFKKKYFEWAAWLATAVAFALHTYGFGLRVYLTERPPVSNMYETVVWVAWGVITFTSIFSFIKKKNYLFILLAGTMAAGFAMVVADRAPLILDSSLQPLEPVLRSNLWLIIHVMTINLSYAAFLLASGISNVGLFYIIRGHKAESPEIREFVDTCYKSLQVGVVLLAAGTILGGVWADYSWGRFWGWDPKETWALISLLGYLALLHGRLAGLVKNFGMLAGSIIAFNLVIMAWYGVNYVLGTGLHSYGFGAGGIEYVSAYVGLQLVYVAYAALRLKL